MKRREVLDGMLLLSALAVVPACGRSEESASVSNVENKQAPEGHAMTDTAIETLEKSKSEWRELLDPEAFDVLFRDRTERPHSSELNDEHRPGTYICAACFLPLFSHDTKFESGTGWPSFFDHIPGHVDTKRDYKMIIPRTEYHCIRCKGHQGHVFNDGPQPTGQRWCNNGVALRFVPEDETLPELRT